MNDSIDILAIQQQLDHLNCDLVDSIESTQSAVKANSLLIAEEQTQGVGRRGNAWLTPHGRSICFSYKFLSSLKPSQLGGFQMAVAVAALNTIKTFDTSAEIKLKWPNDLYTDNQKIAGILINLIPQGSIGTEINTGIGINWSLNASQLASVNRPVANVPIKHKPKRSEFIIQLIKQIDSCHKQFKGSGLISFQSLWQQHDYLNAKEVTLTTPQGLIEGHYEGINQTGELVLRTHSGIHHFSSGEVSVKPV